MDIWVTNKQVQPGAFQVTKRHSVNMAASELHVQLLYPSLISELISRPPFACFCGCFQERNTKTNFSGCTGGDKRIGDIFQFLRDPFPLPLSLIMMINSSLLRFSTTEISIFVAPALTLFSAISRICRESSFKIILLYPAVQSYG